MNSQKLDVAVFYHEFRTVALPFFVGKLYVDGFYNDFQPKHRFLCICSNIPYYMLSIFRKKTKNGSRKKIVHTSRLQQFGEKQKSAQKKHSLHFSAGAGVGTCWGQGGYGVGTSGHVDIYIYIYIYI